MGYLSVVTATGAVPSVPTAPPIWSPAGLRAVPAAGRAGLVEPSVTDRTETVEDFAAREQARQEESMRRGAREEELPTPISDAGQPRPVHTTRLILPLTPPEQTGRSEHLSPVSPSVDTEGSLLDVPPVPGPRSVERAESSVGEDRAPTVRLPATPRIREIRVTPDNYPPELVGGTPTRIRKWLSEHPEVVGGSDEDVYRGGITVEKLIFEQPPVTPAGPPSYQRPLPKGFADYESIRRR